MAKGRLLLLFGGLFTLLGLFAMPMKRMNPKQNLVDNPFGWGMFGFGLSSLMVGLSAVMKNRQEIEPFKTKEWDYPIEQKETPQQKPEQTIH